MAGGDMPRFVLLEHDHPYRHWDFMLEVGAVLWTWRLPSPPAGDALPALRIGAHHPHYLDYEGPVSGDRGTVKRWDRGTFSPEELGDERVRVWLQGERVTGWVMLHRVVGDEWEWRQE